MGRTLIIGDVHGCIAELDMLLDQVALASDDAVVLVGDLVHKGPDSSAVIALCMRLGARAVMGNHDDYLVRAIEARRKDITWEGSESVWKLSKRIGDEHAAWLAARPLYLRLPELGAVVVHGGMVPGVPVEEQKREHLLSMRSVRADGTGTKKLEDGAPWGSLWPGPEHAYFGHDAVRGLQRWDHATGLDTGCVYGGRLTAMLLPARELVSVPARKVYAEPGKQVAASHKRPENRRA